MAERPSILTTSLGLLASSVLLAGCSSAPVHSSQAESQYQRPVSRAFQQPANTDSLHDLLYDQYQQWKGTPYRLGGLNRNGIDCSGFVYRTFRDKLGHRLPRTTRQLARHGRHVAQHELQTGDLVFFRPDGTKRHVGIYLDNGLFLHASTSIGVTISRMDNRYWRRSYWQSRRMSVNY